jgi:hypothetical protein
MKMPKEMTEIEKQGHLFERFESLYSSYVAEYDLSRISWLGAIEAFRAKMIDDWKSEGAFGAEEEDDDDED